MFGLTLSLLLSFYIIFSSSRRKLIEREGEGECGIPEAAAEAS
jgi:hypothetical protein